MKIVFGFALLVSALSLASGLQSAKTPRDLSKWAYATKHEPAPHTQQIADGAIVIRPQLADGAIVIRPQIADGAVNARPQVHFA